MAYPLLESPVGSCYYYNGQIVMAGSSMEQELLKPTDLVTYYETVRIKEGVLLYLEDHLARLIKSVKGIEDFPVDTAFIEKECYKFLHEQYPSFKEGNLRIVLTKSDILIHVCEANIPCKEHFEKGIKSSLLKWDRVAPNIKVFRGDYKSAVAEAFARSGAYEIVLADSNDKLYEGSKSNLFIVVGNKVYSAPDNKILLGITRNRVMSSMKEAGGELVIDMFSLEELKKTEGAALFVSSTPFDILPIASIDDYVFDSANNPLIKRISECYLDQIAKYINERR
ncbi:MAG: aminotransferase class IV [Saccharofermentans sp.]|nr:aminotransferase class IV [Saccharofermentans sp.]